MRPVELRRSKYAVSPRSWVFLFCIANFTKSILGTIDGPKTAWELLEKCFGAKQQGLQSVIMAKPQLSKWDGSGMIHTHRNNMVDLRTKLADTGMELIDQTFYKYFTHSLPTSLDLFITLYEAPPTTSMSSVIDSPSTRCEVRSQPPGMAGPT